MDVSETQIVVEGVRAPVLQTGPRGDEEAVVFVHGNPGSSRDWDDLLERTGTFARAVATDMPGFGRADKPSGFDYTVQGYARFLAGALDSLGIRRAHLVLHDFGGPWGLTWAAANPDSLASVVLVNTGVLTGYRWHYLARIWRAPVLGELFPVEHAALQRQAFPSAEVKVLDDSGHWPFADDPNRVANIIVPFLRRETQLAAQGS
jgi:pimeloyl-ACP methyl ester carboxylesterase